MAGYQITGGIEKEEHTFAAEIPGSLIIGSDGATFVPSIQDGEILQWSNNKGLPNPPPVKIKGEPGPAGPQGEPGNVENVVLHIKQNLTEEQKAQARDNIGAVTMDEVLAALPVGEGVKY